jgi:DNA-binding HxlR family transcriptional regulator
VAVQDSAWISYGLPLKLLNSATGCNMNKHRIMRPRGRKRSERRSGCPINLLLELLGDKWSLVIIRDMIFGNRRHFRELLQKSEEGIASNILAGRLKTMLEHGIITKADDPSHKQKVIYSLTERGIELLPVLVQIADWGRKYLPVTKQHGMAAQLLMEGGPEMCEGFMSELRVEHLGEPARRKSRPGAPSIAAMFWRRPRIWPDLKTGKRRQAVSRLS